MHLSRILILALSFIFFIGQNSFGQDKNYEGYRLYISNIKIVKKSKSKVVFTCDVHNTGSESIKLGNNRSRNIITNIEQEFKEGIHDYLKGEIIQKVLKHKTTLEKSGSFKLKEKIKVKDSFRKVHNERLEMDEKRFLLSRRVDKDICPDLTIDTVFIKKRKRKTITVSYKVTNNGKGAASIYGREDHMFDNISLKVYFSGTKKLSRGAAEVGNFYITDGLEKTKGILFPGQSYEGEIDVSMYKHSRYTNILIFQIDGTQVLIECLEGNNVAYIQL